jgi:hypothetical protein
MKQWRVWVLCLMAGVLFFAGCPTDSDTEPVVDAEKPLISKQPLENTSYVKGAEAVPLVVEAKKVEDGGTLSYQWFKNGTPISGTNTPSYTPPTDSIGDFGYHVEVINTNATVNGVKTMTTRSQGARVVISETPIIIWSVEADGEADKETSTALTFKFSAAVTGLTAEDITLTNANPPVTKGTLTAGEDGKTWTLVLSEVPAQEQLTVSIDKAGIETGSKQVSVHKELPELPLPNPKINFMSIDNDGYGTEAITLNINKSNEDKWVLDAIDQGETYVGVYKTPAQSVWVSGTDAAKVRRLTSNDTIKGEPVVINEVELGDDPGYYAVYKVDTSGFDLLFDGGSLDFTLEVREGAAPVQKVSVTLNVTPTIVSNSITIFSVARTEGQTEDEEGSLTKINAELKIDGKQVRVNTLLDAFKWLDINAENESEYLVRLEKNEVIPKVLFCPIETKTTIRLRGWKEERRITHNGTDELYFNNEVPYQGSYVTDTYAVINIGRYSSSQSSVITLQLEQYITLDGKNVPAANRDYMVEGMVSIMPLSYLIMKPGSKITGYNFPESRVAGGFWDIANPVYIQRIMGKGVGTFILDGGEITGNTVYLGVLWSTSNVANTALYQMFIYKRGKIYNNTALKTDVVEHGNYLACNYYDGDTDTFIDITHEE